MINQFYERAYNTRTGVDGDENAIFDYWRTASEDARASLTCHLDLRYGDANRETVDLFIAEGSTRWLVFIHGGYWRVMTKESSSFLAPPFIAAGINVAMLEYDLCPTVTLSTIVDQCRRGIAWLYHHAADYGSPCDDLTISGHSAGGHLTAMMFATDWSQYNISPDVITGGIAISGLFDLDPLTFTNINNDVRMTPEDVMTLSPSRLEPRVTAPLALTVGERESSEFKRQNEVLRGAPKWDDITSETLIMADRHHFNILDDFMNLNSEMWTWLQSKK